MAGNPTTQTFDTVIKTSLPATISVDGIGGADDVVGALNVLPSAAWNDMLAGVLDIAAFASQGLSVSAVGVTGSRWVDSGGKAALEFNLTTTSDPISAAEVMAVVTTAAVLIEIAMLALLTTVSVGVAAIIIGATLALGILTVLSVSVTEIIPSISPAINAIGIGLAVAGVAAAGVIAYSFVSSAEGRSQVREYTRRAGEYTYGAAKKTAPYVKKAAAFVA